jgi:hypothetical protein
MPLLRPSAMVAANAVMSGPGAEPAEWFYKLN